VWNDPNPSAVLVMIDSMVESSNTLTVALVQLPLRIDGTIKVKNIAKNGMKSSGEVESNVVIFFIFIYRVIFKRKGYKI
jgi:hypothetical protein